MSLAARLKRLESSSPAPAPPDPWAGLDEAARCALAAIFLAAGSAAFDAGQDPIVVGFDALDELEGRLRAEGLDRGPLDHAGRARVEELADAARGSIPRKVAARRSG